MMKHNSFFWLSFWILWSAVFAAPLAMSQMLTKCRVFDPELQANYAGGCADGFADGYGEASGAAEYKGVFRRGRKYGKGVKIWPVSGDRYEGDFIDDRKHGSGTYTWGPRSSWAGEKYSGTYLDDRRDGFGVYEWPGGDRYAGEWKNDGIVGQTTERMFSRARAYGEISAAVNRPGISVCREMTVGIGTRDWIHGTVVSVDGRTIEVRIDDAGRFQHTISDASVQKGNIIRDALQHWIPCRF